MKTKTKSKNRTGRPMWCPPPGINWKLSNTILAQKYRVSWPTIDRHRALAGRTKPCGKGAQVDWGAVDWRLIDSALARDLGVLRMTVAYWREKLGVPQGTMGRKAGSGSKPRFDYGKINWALCNSELSRRFGVTSERIRQIRKKAGLKPSCGKGGPNRRGVYAFQNLHLGS